MIHKPGIIPLPTISGELGDLTFVEGGSAIPFEIRRAYYVYGIPETAVRGGHAHKENLEFVIALSGAFDVKLESQHGDTSRFRLERPDEGLLIPALHWRVLESYAPGSLCLVLASMSYDESRYLRDYDEFRVWNGEP